MGAQPNSTSSGCAPTARILIVSERLSFSNRHTGEGVALPHRVDDVLARSHPPEDSVLSVQVGRGHVGDEELASIGPWAGVRHRKRPDLMLVGVPLELVGETVAGSAPSAPFRIAALDHEVGNHAMEGG